MLLCGRGGRGIFRPMWIRVFGVIVLLIGLGAGVYGVGVMFEQDRAVREFTPVRATVTDSRYDINSSRRSTTYTPKVQYRYTANDHVYLNDQIAVFNESYDTRRDVEAFLIHYPVDAIVTAYVDPRDASNSVLIKQYSSGPYWVALFGLAGAMLGLFMTGGVTSTGPAGMRAVAMGEGWQLLLPRKNLKKRYRQSVMWWVGTAAITLLVMGHYLKVVHPYAAGGYFLLIVAGGWLVWQTVRTLRRRILRGTVSDARVQVNPVPMRREAPVGLRVELDALRPLRVEEAKARLVCTEHYQERRGNKTQVATRVKGERVIEICGAKPVGAGELVEGEGVVELDPTWPATSAKQNVYPHYTWAVKVKVKLAGAADYAEEFVVEVE